MNQEIEISIKTTARQVTWAIRLIGALGEMALRQICWGKPMLGIPRRLNFNELKDLR
ncbi:hypothetical protein ACFSSA_01295 [Luteolibacter algae]|uniref:Uncharacterized protein n=1 Tax=Luteolibacter algae TaxID=454151 RepID=A0ABW5D3D1_9BACT